MSVLSHATHGLGVLTLSRPEALNALSLEMAMELGHVLAAWKNDPMVHVVLLKGTPAAFSAGIDLRAIFQAMLQGDRDLILQLFNNEYLLHNVTEHLGKPLVAVGAGITMGGGMALCMNASRRVVTCTSQWAMPETKIGFFPDAGAGRFFNDCPGFLGTYLALTGATMNAADVLYAGLATHYIADERLEFLEESLKRAPTQDFPEDVLNEVLELLSEEAPMESLLHRERENIDNCFSGSSLQEIFENLFSNKSLWARKTLDILEEASPFSLVLTFEYLKRTKAMPLSKVLELDYKLSQHFIDQKDFAEGIRARIIDKDYAPVWQFKSVADVPADLVESYFS